MIIANPNPNPRRPQLQTSEAETNFDLLREQTADRIGSMQKTIAFLEDKIGMRADEIASKDELLMVEKKLKAKEKVRGEARRWVLDLLKSYVVAPQHLSLL